MSIAARRPAGDVNVGPGFSDSGTSAIAVTGSTTLAILLISIIAMYQGADAQRILLTFSIAGILYAALNYSPTSGLIANMVYLAAVGALKRYMIPFLGYTSLDPLLMVQPVVIGLYFVNVALRKRIPWDTRVSKAIGILLGIMALEVLNPMQGGLALGLAGIMFYIVPVLWYYVGRIHGTAAAQSRLLYAILMVAVVGAIYGLIQQYFGFTEVEKKWLELTRNDVGQYISGGVMRVFSFFSSFAEYTHFICMAAIIAFASFLKGNRFALLPFLFCLLAVLLSSSRGGFVGALFGCSVVWAVQGQTPRTWLPRLVIVVILGASSVYFGLSRVQEANIQDDTTEALLKWQAKGIVEVTDEKSSTAKSHNIMALKGIMRGIMQPLGNGLGTTTIASGKFAAGVGGSAENDIGNMFISCGVFGGVTYVFLVYYVLWRAVRAWQVRRDFVSLCCLGILLFGHGAWLMGARYAACMVTWFLIGGLDRADREEEIQKRLAGSAATGRKHGASGPQAPWSERVIAGVNSDASGDSHS